MSYSKGGQRSRTELSARAIAECPFSIAEEYAMDYLHRAEGGGPEATIRVPWRFPFASLRHRVKLSFATHGDVLEPGRRHDEVRLQWESGSWLLPDFRGTLRFRIDAGRTRILIDGSYLPPLGTLGRCYDRLLGRRIARSSLQELANRIASYLGRRERHWRSGRNWLWR